MELKVFMASLTLATVAIIGHSEAKVNMFELLIARNGCMKTSPKSECNIEFFKSICANRKAFSAIISSFGYEGNIAALCNCVEQFSR